MIEQAPMLSCVLPLSYYQHEDVVFLSRDLLGKYLYTQHDTIITGGMIVETEAYRGPEDRASHAYGNRRTRRNEVMYWKGGTSYIFQCYGIHSLFNVVTNVPDTPHAILIRAIQPIFGFEAMMARRHMQTINRRLTGGPGALTVALGIIMKDNGLPLDRPPIWIENHGTVIADSDIIASPRVGVDYAGEDAKKPWRFRIKNNPWTSPAK